MSVQLSELTQFAGDLAQAGFRVVQGEHLLLIINHIPYEKLKAMFNAAKAGDALAKTKLDNYLSFATAHTMLQQRYHLNIPLDAIAGIHTRDPKEYSALMNGIRAGSAEAIDAIRHLAINQAPEQRYATPVAVSGAAPRTPIHATQVPPPAAAAPLAAVAPPVAVTAPVVTPLPVVERQFAEDQGSYAPPAAAKSERNYDNVHVYGRKTALAFDHSPTRDRTSTTINISLGKAKGETCIGGVDWASKITIMLTSKEVALIAAVLLGQIQSVRFAGHGSNNEKWIEVSEAQDPGYQGSIKVTMAQGKDIRNCSITYNDILDVLAIFNRAMISQHTGAAAITVPQMTMRVSNLYQKAMQRKAG